MGINSGNLDGEADIPLMLDFAVSEGEGFEVVITPRPGTRVVRLDGPSVRLLRDLAGATFDMKRVAQLCKEYVAASDSGSPQIVTDALWITAVVLYVRCFNGGVRRPLDTKALDSLDGESREVHQHLLELRDKFIAHSVNSYEQTLVYGVVSDTSGEVSNTGTTHLWANPMNREGAQILERLAWTFYNAGMEQRALLEIMVGREVAKLGRAEVARLPTLTVDPPSAKKSGLRRKP